VLENDISGINKDLEKIFLELKKTQLRISQQPRTASLKSNNSPVKRQMLLTQESEFSSNSSHQSPKRPMLDSELKSQLQYSSQHHSKEKREESKFINMQEKSESDLICKPIKLEPKKALQQNQRASSLRKKKKKI